MLQWFGLKVELIEDFRLCFVYFLKVFELIDLKIFFKNVWYNVYNLCVNVRKFLIFFVRICISVFLLFFFYKGRVFYNCFYQNNFFVFVVISYFVYFQLKGIL